VKAYIHSGKLTAGHARMLVGEPDAEALANDIVARDLNVRQVEAMARERAQASGRQSAKVGRPGGSTAKEADVLALEKRLSDALGLAVSIDQRRGGGVVSIRYRNLDQLDDVLRRLEKRH
jgi:ParB family chromosome partitioning protein